MEQQGDHIKKQKKPTKKPTTHTIPKKIILKNPKRQRHTHRQTERERVV